eukprot:PhF_6_TR24426/c0_g1_i1/m.33785
MLRVTVRRNYKAHFLNFYSPVTEIPVEYTMRLAPKVMPRATEPRDPNNRWGLLNYERGLAQPIAFSHKRDTHLLDNVMPLPRAGPITELPPVPVYREHIWCQGQISCGGRHYRIFIKCPPGKVTQCKWCRMKYLNMATDDDNDEDWQEICNAAMLRPETREQGMRPHRSVGGTWYPNPYPNGPHPEVYRTWVEQDAAKEKAAQEAHNAPQA